MTIAMDWSMKTATFHKVAAKTKTAMATASATLAKAFKIVTTTTNPSDPVVPRSAETISTKTAMVETCPAENSDSVTKVAKNLVIAKPISVSNWEISSVAPKNVPHLQNATLAFLACKTKPAGR